jgi:hypothetical protein
MPIAGEIQLNLKSEVSARLRQVTRRQRDVPGLPAGAVLLEPEGTGRVCGRAGLLPEGGDRDPQFAPG